MLDLNSSTWKEIETWAHADLAKFRAQLEQPALDDRASTLIRGRLLALKALLALAKAPADVPTEPQSPVGY